jgi:DNA-binding MarR family transcriptional regulator
MSSKDENINLILRKLVITPRRWSELMDILEVSEATLSRYLKELRDKNLIEKKFDSHDNVVYSPKIVNLVSENKLEIDFIQRSKKSNKLLAQLNEIGLFDEGINSKEILDFLKNNSDSDLIPIPKAAIEDREKLDLDLWKHFNIALNSLLSNEIGSEIETTMKVNGNVEDFKIDIESMNEDLEKMSEEIEEN